MPEIISLISSPPASPVKSAVSLQQRPPTKVFTDFHFSSDDFGETGELDFQAEQPSKKRKIDDAATRSTKDDLRSFTKDLDVAIDLSSDIEVPILPSKRHQKPHAAYGLPHNVDEIDDIVFSSSAPAHPTVKGKNALGPAHTYDLSSDSLPDDPLEALLSASQPARTIQSKPGFSVKTSNLLAGLSADAPPVLDDKSQRRSGNGPSAISAKHSGAKKDSIDDIVISSPPKAAGRNSRPKFTGDSTKQSDAPAKKAQKASEKEAEKAQKAAEKIQKARDKQKAADLAEVNKSKTNKKDAVGEMQVEVSNDLRHTSVGNQLQGHLDNVKVPMSYVEEEVNLEDASVRYQGLGSKIRWKRNVQAAYDEEQNEWSKVTPRTLPEQHVLIYLKANDFAMIASGYSGEAQSTVPTEASMKEHFDLHVSTLRSRYKNCIIVYLIEGLFSWLKKNHNAKNREYTAKVRAQQAADEATDTIASSQVKPRKAKKAAAVDLSFITEDTAEDLLLHIQVTHQPIFIHHTTSPTTTAEQIFTFTQHLSTRLYRQNELLHNIKTASFCMTTGQVKTGDDARDTYVKMLQELTRVTPGMAYGIENQYSSVKELVKGFRQEGNLMLEDVRKSNNSDGAWSDRKLGPMVSKRLYKVFMGRDKDAMDGMS